MQTDAEIDPRLARDIQKDIDLAGSIKGIDVLFGGHADAGTWEPVIQPETGTLIMQTFGQATYLGFLQLTLDSETKKIKKYDGKLIPVNADLLEPDKIIVEKNNSYRNEHPEITKIVGKTTERLNRKYFDESDLGNLLADIATEMSGADIGLIHPGTIRKDIPKGNIEIADVLDTNPFVDPIVVIELSGLQLKKALEQSFTLLRGLLQVSGIEVVYDTSRPERQRLISLTAGGVVIDDNELILAAMPEIIAKGGDHYDEFTDSPIVKVTEPLGDLMIKYFQKYNLIDKPKSGRQKDIAENIDPIN